MHVRQLRGQVAQRAAAHAVALALRLEHAVEEAADLRERAAGRVREARIERALDERGDELVEDRVPELFLALEVVVEVALAGAALAQDVVERRGVVAVDVDQTPGRVEDRLAGAPSVPGSTAVGRGLHVYRPVGTTLQRRGAPVKPESTQGSDFKDFGGSRRRPPLPVLPPDVLEHREGFGHRLRGLRVPALVVGALGLGEAGLDQLDLGLAVHRLHRAPGLRQPQELGLGAAARSSRFMARLLPQNSGAATRRAAITTGLG